jgi:hypothetical protein
VLELKKRERTRPRPRVRPKPRARPKEEKTYFLKTYFLACKKLFPYFVKTYFPISTSIQQMAPHWSILNYLNFLLKTHIFNETQTFFNILTIFEVFKYIIII